MQRQPRMLMNKTWPLIPVGWADDEIGPLSAACQKFSLELFTRGVTMWTKESLVSLSSGKIFSQFPCPVCLFRYEGLQTPDAFLSRE